MTVGSDKAGGFPLFVGFAERVRDKFVVGPAIFDFEGWGIFSGKGFYKILKVVLFVVGFGEGSAIGVEVSEHKDVIAVGG